ncbi:MAG: iron-sulfur cluster repair di-iron protein [Acidimicrobiales bacterium]
MTPIDPEALLGDLVSARPVLAPVLDDLGLDYCCGGQRSLGSACRLAGLDANEVVARLRDASHAADAAPPEWAGLGPAELVDHLEAVHHRYLDDELSGLAELADKVATVHGARHPELAEVVATYGELRADLEPHLRKEELVLFPMIRRLDAAGGESLDPPLPMALAAPVSVMLAEHEQAGELLARLRELTGGYAPPDDACASYRSLYERLAALEADTHLHVHKESNVLFPMVLELEAAGS